MSGHIGSAAHALAIDGHRLQLGDSVGAGTPIIDIADLNGDRLLDVAALQNNYEPDYATGKVQYQTFERTIDGLSFTKTGCGPLQRKKPPTPSSLQTGSCSFS